MLKRFLPTVVSHCPADCEVVVADNGSTDGSVAYLQSQHPDVRLILLDKNYGFAEGYNRALEHIDAPYSVLLNSDVWVDADWVTPVLDYMDAHPRVAAAQPKVHKFMLDTMTPSTRFEHAGAAGGEIDILGYPFCRGRILNYVEEDHGQYDQIVPIFWASGCAMFTRTAVYKALGGLDASFFAHMEEIDLCWRMQRAGYQVMSMPESVVYHVGGGALHYEHPRKTYLNFRNNLLMLHKNLPWKRRWWVMTLRFFLDYVAALQLLVTGKPKNAWAAVQARWDYHKMKNSTQRSSNPRSTPVALPDSIVSRSILVDYYLLHKKQ